MTPIALPFPSSAERYRMVSIDLIRRRALDRLYERRAAVDDLIRSLENYQRAQEPRAAECIEFRVPSTKCSSGFAQSQI